MSRRGSIGVVCLLLSTLLLLVCQSVYSLLYADYRYIKSYVRQRQIVYAVSSGLQALERATVGSSTNINVSMSENLLPDERLTVVMSSYIKNGVKWLSCRGSCAEQEITMVQGVFHLPAWHNALYVHTLVASSFTIDPTATIEGTTQSYATVGDGKFVDFTIPAYTRYAFSMPDNEGWKAGLGKGVFTDPLGGSIRLVGKMVRGSGVFASGGDIYVSAGGNYPECIQLIAAGNVIIEGNAKLDNVFILSAASVKISQGSRVSGKIFARGRIIVEGNVRITDLEAVKLTINTDKYLW